jgi:hypothetical protein
MMCGMDSSFLARIWRRVVDEPAATLAVAIAAVNSTPVGEQSWKGYAIAVVVALGRWAVKPMTKVRREERSAKRSA